MLIELESSAQLTSQPDGSRSRLRRSSLSSTLASMCNRAGRRLDLQGAVDFRVERAPPSPADRLDRRRALIAAHWRPGARAVALARR
jgi:hypothetical protein